MVVGEKQLCIMRVDLRRGGRQGSPVHDLFRTSISLVSDQKKHHDIQVLFSEQKVIPAPYHTPG